MHINPYPHKAILQQMTFRKILNVQHVEHFLSWKPAGAISSFAIMFSNVVCCSRRKNEHLWSKGLTDLSWFEPGTVANCMDVVAGLAVY